MRHAAVFACYFVLALAPATLADSSAPAVTFGAEVPLTLAESTMIRAALDAGWREFARMTGADRAPVPAFVETNFARARVAVVRGYYPVAAEVRWADGANKQPYIYVYLDLFTAYGAQARWQVVTHELFHFYYDLPDHHRGYAAGDHPSCVMDNWFRASSGWSGDLCESCRSKVDAARIPTVYAAK